MDNILAKLSEQRVVLLQQKEALDSIEDDPGYRRSQDQGSSSNSLPITPATETFRTTAPTTRPASANYPENQENDEVFHLKLQLAQAQTQITKLEQIAQTSGGPSELDQQNLYVPRGVTSFGRDSPWNTQDDALSDTSDPLPMSGFSRSRGIWGGFKNNSAVNLTTPSRPFASDSSAAGWNRTAASPFPPGPPFSEHQNGFPPPEGFRGGRLTPEADFLLRRAPPRGPMRFDTRLNESTGFVPGYGGAFASPPSQCDPLMSAPLSSGQMTPAAGFGPMSLNPYVGGPGQPQGTSLSPHASEFTSKGAWKGEVS